MTKQNIVNSSNKDVYYKICKIVLRSAKYGEEIGANTINASKNAPNSKGFKRCELVLLNISYPTVPISQDCPIMACECRGFIPGKKKMNFNFRIAATSNPNEVILLKNNGVYRSLVPVYNFVEYFEEIHLEYLENYELY